MKSLQNFSIVQNMKAYFSDDLYKLQKRIDGPITSQNSINTNILLLPDLKSIILNESDLERLNYEGLLPNETYSRSVTTDTSSKLPIIEDQFVSEMSIFQEFDEF
ncbi:unnamed protein product [Paramecium pentaurelia]|uniref:Uncharacterized protein n=1 Tax=Paramecium pentaurelia TaxID=43138 RepID=A0A8S1WZG7_9CILI|nr:unnamed protein product [Paramecium pentaurelia]